MRPTIRATMIALAALAVLGACAVTPQQLADRQARADAELADALKGRVAGTPVNCIDASGTDGPQIIGDDTLLYRRGGLVYRTTVKSCPSLSSRPTIVARIYGSQLCRQDYFTTVQNGTSIPSGACFYGDFTPYKRAAN